MELQLIVVAQPPPLDVRIRRSVQMAPSNVQVDQSDFGVAGVYTGTHASSFITSVGNNSSVSFGGPSAGESLEAAIKACRNTLLLTKAEDDRSALISAKGERVEGTCEWIKDNNVFINWEAWRIPLL